MPRWPTVTTAKVSGSNNCGVQRREFWHATQVLVSGYSQLIDTGRFAGSTALLADDVVRVEFEREARV